MEHILQTEREALKLRLLALAIVGGGLYLAGQSVPWLPASILAIAYLIYVVVLRELLLPRFQWPEVVYAMIVVDVAAVSLGLLIVGQIATPLFILYPVLILYYCIHLGYRSSLTAATASSLAYAGVAVLTGGAEWFGAFTTVQVPLFYLLAIVGGFLAQKRFQERREKESLLEAIRVERGAKSLLDVTRALSTSLDAETVKRQILDSAVTLTGMSEGVIALLEEETGKLVVRALKVQSWLLGKGVLKEGDELPQTDAISQQALQTMRPQAVASLRDEREKLPSWLRDTPYQALLAIPLAYQGRPIGLIYLLGQGVSQESVNLAPGLGELAGVALGNAGLYGQAQSRLEQLRAEFQGLVERMDKLRQAQRKRIIEVNGLRIDRVKREVSLEGEPVSLSPIEFDLLCALAENASEPLSHDTLLHLVWGPEYEGRANVVDVSIHRLRRKMEAKPSWPKLITTVRGAGYMLAVSPQQKAQPGQISSSRRK
jgi:DNA-binding winged helix-turn-helix (wHTH) protein